MIQTKVFMNEWYTAPVALREKISTLLPLEMLILVEWPDAPEVEHITSVR